MPLRAAIATDIGVVRTENQDRAVIARGRTGSGATFVVAALADGIGGMSEGALCASIALSELLAKTLRYANEGSTPEASLEKAVQDANALVHSQSHLRGGTTLVALLTIEGHLPVWASIGDSRLYRATNAELVQLSKDDTIAGQLDRRTDISTEQSKLLQFVGMGDDVEVRIHSTESAPDATAILTTDGVHFLERSGGVLGLVVQNAPDTGTCARRLIELSRWAGGPDNASAVVIPLRQDLHDQLIPSGCMDIWDSFGEIRVSEPLPVPPEADEARSPNRTNDSGHGPQARVTPSEAPRVSNSGENTSKQKEKRQPKRRKKAAKKTASRPAKAPQVQLQFSDKDD